MSATRPHGCACLAGALAGLAGSAALFAMRSFDNRYAPATVPEFRADPGSFLVRMAASLAGMTNGIPPAAEAGTSLLLGAAYGSIAGAIYGKIRGRKSNASPLIDGSLLGTIVYAIGYVAWLPLFGLTRPLWKQRYPQIAGGLLRHVAFGVATAAVFGAINA